MELIKVESREGKQLCSARDIHEYLEVKTRFNDWINRCIEKYDFEEGAQYSKLSTVVKHSTGGKKETDFVVTIEMAKELCMIADTPKGKETRKYFIDLERRALENAQKPMLPQNYAEALRALLKSIEDKQEADKKIEQLTLEDKHNKEVIIALVEPVDLATQRQRINQVVKHGAGNGGYQERWILLYKEFDMKYNMNLKQRMKSKAVESNTKIKNRLDLIESYGQIPDLYELACLLFNTSYEEITKRLERNSK